MSRKFGKFLLLSAVAGAAACGTWYYLKSKEVAPAPAKEPDGDDDFDDFGEDLDDEENVTRERSYVSLNLDKAEAFATEAFHKAKEVIADSVQQVKDTVKSVAESQMNHECSFTDLTAVNSEKESEDAAQEDNGSESAEDKSDKAESMEAESARKVSDDMTEVTAADAESGSTDETATESEPATVDEANGTVEEFFDDDKN